MGSGKTCMAQGIGSGMGVAGVINSPFVFVSEHAPVTRALLLPSTSTALRPDRGATLRLEDYMYGDGVSVMSGPIAPRR